MCVPSKWTGQGTTEKIVSKIIAFLVIVGGEGLAMTTPTSWAGRLVISLHFREVKGFYHGAKNSTRMRGSLVIALKLVGVTSMTSEASSEMAMVTSARAVRERRREENFMTEGGRGWCEPNNVRL